MSKPVILEIIQFPDPRLFRPVSKVVHFASDLFVLGNNMRATMEASNGVGISAIQVGFGINMMIVCDPETGIKRTMFNTEIVEAKGSQLVTENCLSRFGLEWVQIERPYQVTANYQDIFGKPKTVKLTGVGAECLVHEELHQRGVNPIEVVELPYQWIK